jgi:acyl carrier protein
MDKLYLILRELHPEVDFETCDDLIDAGVLDSFDIVSMIASINEVFDITVPPQEIIPDNFNSAQAIYAMIQRIDED